MNIKELINDFIIYHYYNIGILYHYEIYVFEIKIAFCSIHIQGAAK